MLRVCGSDVAGPAPGPRVVVTTPSVQEPAHLEGAIGGYTQGELAAVLPVTATKGVSRPGRRS
jgi:hypothetical protein